MLLVAWYAAALARGGWGAAGWRSSPGGLVRHHATVQRGAVRRPIAFVVLRGLARTASSGASSPSASPGNRRPAILPLECTHDGDWRVSAGGGVHARLTCRSTGRALRLRLDAPASHAAARLAFVNASLTPCSARTHSPPCRRCEGARGSLRSRAGGSARRGRLRSWGSPRRRSPRSWRGRRHPLRRLSRASDWPSLDDLLHGDRAGAMRSMPCAAFAVVLRACAR